MCVFIKTLDHFLTCWISPYTMIFNSLFSFRRDLSRERRDSILATISEGLWFSLALGSLLSLDLVDVALLRIHLITISSNTLSYSTRLLSDSVESIRDKGGCTHDSTPLR